MYANNNENQLPLNSESVPSFPTSERMSNEEMLTRQLYLHQQIQKQMQMQMEMSLQMGKRQSGSSTISKVDPDLGDNVFDMIDDLIMIPNSTIQAERGSYNGQELEDDNDMASGRDSLADIIESLDMDLEDLQLDNMLSRSQGNGRNDTLDETQCTEELLSDDDSRDSDLIDMDSMDLSLDDDDDDDNSHNIHHSPFWPSKDPNESSVEQHNIPRPRFSSQDMLASVSGSLISSQYGNMCTLVWEEGSLGLRLRMSQSRMIPAVSKVTGRSSIFGIHLIDVGDLLIQIGTQSTRDLQFNDAIKLLKESRKPCSLTFRRLTADPMAVTPVQRKLTSPIALKLAEKLDELSCVENERLPSAPVVRLELKYEVKWIDGPLGISLIASKDAPYPLVTRITGKNRSSQISDVQPGHFLVRIGMYNTSSGNFNSAIKYLQKVSKPVSLYFCPSSKMASVRPEMGPNEYDQVWEKKQALSFTVKPDACGRMVVSDLGNAKSIKPKGKPMPGISPTLAVGDWILYINGDSTQNLTFHVALLKLRSARRPLVIRFRRESELFKETVVQHSPSSQNEQTQSATPRINGRLIPGKPAVPIQIAKENNTHTSVIARTEQKREALILADSDKHSLGRKTTNREAEDEIYSGPRSRSSINHTVPDIEKIVTTSVAPITGHTTPSLQKFNADCISTASTLTPDQHLKSSNSLGATTTHAQLIKCNSTPLPSTPAQSSKILSISPAKKNQPQPIKIPNIASANISQPQALKIEAAPPKTIVRSDGTSVIEEYEVVWPEGTALGLTLRVHPTTRFPVVARVTGTSNLGNIEHVSPGDILFAANNVPIVPQPKFKQTLENLSKIPKPAVLRFRRNSQALVSEATLPRGPAFQDGEYELLWRESTNLGLVFSADGDLPRVTKVDLDSGGTMLSKVSLGDTLTWIGAMNIGDMTFHYSMATLRATKRPVVLRFQKRPIVARHEPFGKPE
ncbi:unnamed protein product [Albugo candida]|uniref:PDZ domain-containing protein n=1 Tax=Albugo candida TaxID=65357 RepID=A0A024G5F1_9STRA|nr:unnamed protein product [Albugo candida]|eukprot:CCI42095.1 unnamed protein product [Albugo candida]